MENVKARGPDEIAGEIFKFLSGPAVEGLISIFNFWYETGSLLNDFRRSIFLLLPKSLGDKMRRPSTV